VINRRRLPQRGFGMIKAIVYVAVVGMIMGAVTAGYLSLSRGSASVSRHTAFLHSVDRFRDELVEDLRLSEGIPASAQGLEASEELLLLKMPGDRLKVWTLASGGKGVYRYEMRDGTKSEPTHALRFGQARFAPIERDGQRVGVIVEASLGEDLKPGKIPFRSFLSFSAFMGVRR